LTKSNQAKLPQEVNLETAELAKINYAELEERQLVLDHIFAKIFIYKKWKKVRWCFRISRLLHVKQQEFLSV